MICWQILPTCEPPVWLADRIGNFAAQLLWQRGIRKPEQVEAFLSPEAYHPTSAFAFGAEMQAAIARIQQAYATGEKVAIWGDFDADGITATSVLWEGLGEFFSQSQQLSYFIPDRLTASHGLSIEGIDALKQWFLENSHKNSYEGSHADSDNSSLEGISSDRSSESCEQGQGLIVTCDTGSTNLTEILYASSLGIDIIVTDHHTLPAERPPVTAIVNPRYLDPEHPLFHLSGVAVAYKLIEALYETLPDVPQQPLENLLDLVAIGLVADLVQLVGDCRYLAQRGIEVLKQKSRLGVKFLLEQCKKAGDRPTDISFGIAPRINSVSRIWGDVRKCVELLTSKDEARCQELVKLAELANTQRKALQKKVFAQVKAKLDRIDLSTMGILVLDDPQWSVGILGLVAGQVASEYGRPVILCTIEDEDGKSIAKGSARSPSGIDLYDLIKGQEHLLLSFGGHPLAAGLSLPAENLPLLREALNQRFWSQYDLSTTSLDRTSGRKGILSSLQIDLVVKIADLGQQLFRELKLLEPYGMGNPAPKLLIQNCHFEDKFNANIKNIRGQKVEYIKSEFSLVDETGEIRGDWWGHYSYEIPDGVCDVVVELIDNSFKKTYEVRIIDIHTQEIVTSELELAKSIEDIPTASASPSDIAILDWRGKSTPLPDGVIACDRCPTSWQEIHALIEIAARSQQPLALIYPPPENMRGGEAWRILVGIAKHLDRTGKVIDLDRLQSKLGIRDPKILQEGLTALESCGWFVNQMEGDSQNGDAFRRIAISNPPQTLAASSSAQKFIKLVNELAFQQQFFDRQTIQLIPVS
ncbi:DHH family phosphoesterase [Tumidithrix helvetica PCC 7403]|uniref:single-stranded-DNA-specific exonuclease RecJ n=1 Tax=Tumidithrix helvetica TaxID=3457545 RepID=UPI003CB2BE6A